MTSTENPALVETTKPAEATSPHASFRQIWLLANVWLLFLLFPLIAIVVSDLGAGRKSIAIGLLAIFALVHMQGYREMIRRSLGLDGGEGNDRGLIWFLALVSITVAAFVVASWSALSVVPFLAAFAIFHFTWRVALTITAASVIAVIAIPAIGGVLDQAWFLSILVASVAGAAALNRMDNERQEEQAVLRAQLAVSQERDRLARDVHDVLGHSLTVVILKAQVCDRLLGSLGAANGATQDVDATISQTRAQLDELESVSRRALAEIRATVGGLRAANLADELAAARVVLADAEVELTTFGEASDIEAPDQPLLAWVVREAITNIVRHARATQCQIHLSPDDRSGGERVLIRIIDNGVGLGASPPGNGLTGLHERVDAHRATLQIRSTDGTELTVIDATSDVGAPHA